MYIKNFKFKIIFIFLFILFMTSCSTIMSIIAANNHVPELENIPDYDFNILYEAARNDDDSLIEWCQKNGRDYSSFKDEIFSEKKARNWDTASQVTDHIGSSLQESTKYIPHVENYGSLYIIKSGAQGIGYFSSALVYNNTSAPITINNEYMCGNSYKRVYSDTIQIKSNVSVHCSYSYDGNMEIYINN